MNGGAMKKLLLACLLVALPALAQAPTITGSLTAQDSGACTTANACLVLNLAGNSGVSLIQLSGTFMATVQFEGTANNGATWVAVLGSVVGSTSTATSSTSAGAWRVNAGGLNSIRLRVSAYTSGAVTAVITSSPASASTGGGGGGGTVGPGTTGYIPKFTASTTIGNSACDDGVTTASTVTCSEPITSTGTVTAGSSGMAGVLSLNGSTSGAATLTAPAIAGTATNPIASSNNLTLPSNLTAGTDNTTAGTVTLSNSAASAHNIFGSGATTTNTILGFPVVPVTADAIKCVTSSTTCTLTDSGLTMPTAAGTARVAQVICSQVAVTLNTSAISSATTDSAATGTCTGATTSDSVNCTFAADPTGNTGFTASTNGILTIFVYPTSNTINIKYQNNTAGSITPHAETANCAVYR